MARAATKAFVFLAVSAAAGSTWAQSAGSRGGSYDRASSASVSGAGSSRGSSMQPNASQLGRGLALQGRGGSYQISGPRGTVYVNQSAVSRATGGQFGRTQVLVLDRSGTRQAETSVRSRTQVDGQHVSASIAAYQARALNGTARGLQLTPGQLAAMQRNQVEQSHPTQRALIQAGQQMRESEVGREIRSRVGIAAVTAATTTVASGSLTSGSITQAALTAAAGGAAGAALTLIRGSGAVSSAVRAIPANATQNRQQAETTAHNQITTGQLLRVEPQHPSSASASSGSSETAH
jgi:hypothetical protein